MCIWLMIVILADLGDRALDWDSGDMGANPGCTSGLLGILGQVISSLVLCLGFPISKMGIMKLTSFVTSFKFY